MSSTHGFFGKKIFFFNRCANRSLTHLTKEFADHFHGVYARCLLLEVLLKKKKKFTGTLRVMFSEKR